MKIRLLNSLISISLKNCFKLKDLQNKGEGIFKDILTTEHLKNKLIEFGRNKKISLSFNEDNSKASILFCEDQDKLTLNLPLIKMESQIYDIKKFDNKDEVIDKESKEISKIESFSL